MGRPLALAEPRIQWDYAAPLILLHVLALGATIPWLFSWSGLIALVAGVFFFGQGINFCYHRLLTHRSLVVPRWLEHFWVVIALCCLEDTPCRWVTAHRHHHQHSDEQEDPHSPLVSFFWGHFQWLTRRNDETQSLAAFQRYARGILADPFYMAMEKNRLLAPLIYLGHTVLFFIVGYVVGTLVEGTAMGGLHLGLSLVVWGVVLRTVVVWHITWSVNSVTHLWGYCNYGTGDHSRNNWLVGLIAAGEGWHNNHHEDPASASNQHRWWELDPTYYHILVLKWVGLAKKVVPTRRARLAKREQGKRVAVCEVAPSSQ